ncbi:hypothetical protein EX30DRAFT_375590 [Ascodesmis nigricans]|uniref:Uncharacterized protein n=1 Tax=Ascodesmis nigricans TaxID=341454 RepID=A0A4S2MHE6_9PEZI|nr:hypothetical protein EX30DRAFT_375590 [Ascodesmis nigricans]
MDVAGAHEQHYFHHPPPTTTRANTFPAVCPVIPPPPPPRSPSTDRFLSSPGSVPVQLSHTPTVVSVAPATSPLLASSVTATPGSLKVLPYTPHPSLLVHTESKEGEMPQLLRTRTGETILLEHSRARGLPGRTYSHEAGISYAPPPIHLSRNLSYDDRYSNVALPPGSSIRSGRTYVETSPGVKPIHVLRNPDYRPPRTNTSPRTIPALPTRRHTAPLGDRIHNLTPTTPLQTRCTKFIDGLNPTKPDAPEENPPFEYPDTIPCRREDLPRSGRSRGERRLERGERERGRYGDGRRRHYYDDESEWDDREERELERRLRGVRIG